MTLTQVAIITKRGVLTFTALLILGTVTAIGYRVLYDYNKSIQPPVEEKPNLKFGTLAKIVFPKSAVSSSNYSYSVDTETGSFLPMPKVLKVYFIPRANIVSLLAPDESQKLAGKFGFNSPREVLSPTTYQYKDNLNGIFTIDLISGNFNFQKQVATPSAKLDTTFTNPDQLINSFKGLLRVNGVLNEDLDKGRTKVVYDKSTPNNSTSAIVSVWPADLDGLQIVTSSTSASLVNATASNSNNDTNRFSILNYTYWQIDKTTFATYPLQPVEEAFTQLQSGQGHITQVPPNAKISITRAYLAYFESEEYAPYLQPVYVFEGPDFTGLVPAIKSD